MPTSMPVPVIDKNRPSPEWIAELRRRFPCEPEMDRVLVRKLELRGGPGYNPVSLDQLRAGTEALIRARIGDDFNITNARWLSGGASKLQMVFDLDWNDPAGTHPGGRTTTRMVMRMQPAESISETSRAIEFQAIRALAGHIPVPPTYWVDPDGSFLPYPAIVYGFAEGVAKPSATSSKVSGVGTWIPPEVRATLGAQFVGDMARLHTFDWAAADLGVIDKPASAQQALEWQLNHWERVWIEDAREEIPLMRLAMGWLRRNIPECDQLSLVHGDFRVGNFLFTEPDYRISAWLDWEYAHISDRHEDLAWSIKSMFGQVAEDGHILLVGGLVPREQFLADYAAATGLPVDPVKLAYWDIFNSFKCIAIVLGTGCRVASLGKTHQDVLVAWLAGIGYPLLEDLRGQLEGVL